MKNDVDQLEKRYNRIHSMAEEVVEALLHATIEG